MILPKLSEMLGKSPYFCGSQSLTVVDIVFFNELYLIVKFFRFDFGSYEVLDNWFRSMQIREEIKTLLRVKVDKALEDHNLVATN